MHQADGGLAGIVSRSDLLAVYDRPDSDIADEIMSYVIGDEFVLDSRPFTVTEGTTSCLMSCSRSWTRPSACG